MTLQICALTDRASPARTLQVALALKIYRVEAVVGYPDLRVRLFAPAAHLPQPPETRTANVCHHAFRAAAAGRAHDPSADHSSRYHPYGSANRVNGRSAVAMTVVDVGIMGMDVSQPLVPVRVGVGLSGWILRPVLVPVVLIVHVGMAVLQRFVLVTVLVPLAQVQPESQRHEGGRGKKQGARRLPVEQQSEHSSDEWRE